MVALGLPCRRDGCGDDAAGREAAPPLACQDSSQGLKHKSRHWSHPDPLNKSGTVHTPPIPPPHPSGQDRVRQGHPWRPETRHSDSKGARERGCEFQGQEYRVRPAGRRRLCPDTPESGVTAVATGVLSTARTRRSRPM